MRLPLTTLPVPGRPAMEHEAFHSVFTKPLHSSIPDQSSPPSGAGGAAPGRFGQTRAAWCASRKGQAHASVWCRTRPMSWRPTAWPLSFV